MKKRHKPKPQRKAPRSAKPVQSAPVRAKSGASAAKRPVAAHVAARRDIAERPSGLWYASFSQPAQRSTTRSLAYSTVKARGAAVATAFEGDDPDYLGLLLLPLVLLAGMLAAGQSLRMPSRIMMPVVASLPSLSRPTPAPVAVSTARPVDVASLTQLPRLSLPTRARVTCPMNRRNAS